MDRSIGQLEELPEVPIKKSLKAFYFDFLRDLKDYLPEFVKESVVELCISELPIKGEVKLFDGFTQGKVIIKNQGNVSCYITTAGRGGFRLDPNEKEEFFVNAPVIATTLSGSTILGFIKS